MNATARQTPSEHHQRYRTAGGVTIDRTATPTDLTSVSEAEISERLAEFAVDLERRRGGILSSGIDYPGRYTRWHVAYIDPPVEITARGRVIAATALNGRGRVLLPVIADAVAATGRVLVRTPDRVAVEIPAAETRFPEEERSRQPSVFSALRAIVAAFAHPDDHQLGLYGAYGYDLAFQFEPLRLAHDRSPSGPPGSEDMHMPPSPRDLVLHLPDEILMVDRKRELAVRYSYDFTIGDTTTVGQSRATEPTPTPRAGKPLPPPPTPGRFAQIVREAKERFLRGDLFEVTPSHVVSARCESPARLYTRLRELNPAPYEFFFNLGEGEYLVGASPEMYVRVTGDRVETCPIAGTINRGADAFEDAERIQTLLTSQKDDAELTMCTDVDRNDKARICVPGSVRVIGRRQIELYSRLIHTVDHIEGRLRPGMDAFDAFLTHMWAVTVTGAPKQWAMQFIEDHEDGPRRWYGGAIGFVGFDRSMNTGLILRAAHIEDGIASVRVGATLLYDSDPEAEERETYLKARAVLDALGEADGVSGSAERDTLSAASNESLTDLDRPGEGMRVLVVDHQDSFVHTLGDYFRQQGAEVTTLRFGFPESVLDDMAPDLVVLSPGPGRPTDFDCASLLKALEARRLPVFGVCLGLQAMVEYDGGKLDLLSYPAHGKDLEVRVQGGRLFAGFAHPSFRAARYHSLYATPEQVEAAGGHYQITATGEDPNAGSTGIVTMAIEDDVRRWYAVQFHPESILTTAGRAGHRIIGNVLRSCRSDRSS
jgi:anthranilate synthase